MSSYRSHNEKYEIQIPKASSSLVYGGVLTFVAGIILLISFASPYWLVSWEYTFSPFKRMGLWEFCFDSYRHPNYQFDKLFTGCHWVFSQEFLIIREWILPGWLMTVQAFFTLAFITSLSTQFVLALLVMRWPLQIILDNEWVITMGCCIGNAITAIFILLSISIFGGQYDRRDWLQYPSYNYPSWAYAFAIGSLLLHGLAALILYKEAQEAKERVVEGEGHLALPMHPTGNPRSESRGLGGMSNPGSESQHYI